MTEVQQLALGFYRSGMPINEYCMFQEYAYPQIIKPGLLQEGIKEILVDFVQAGLGAGAIALTGGMGGDTAVDVLFAVESAKSVESAVSSLSKQGDTMTDVMSDIASLDTSQGLEGIYRTIQSSVDTIISGLESGTQIKKFFEDTRQTILDLLMGVINSVGKWVATMIPDDAGLSGTVVREAVVQALKKGLNYPYDALSAQIGALPSEARDVLLDPASLEAFLIDLIDSLITYLDDYRSEDKGVVSKWTDYMPGIGTAKALAKGEFKTAIARSVSDIVPGAKLVQGVAQETPLVRNFLDNTVRNNVPVAVATFNKIVSLLLGGVALLQVVMQGDFEGSKSRKMAAAGEEAKTLLGNIVDDVQQKIAAESLRSLMESSSEEEIELVASDGETVVVPPRSEGLETGWAIITNPYYHFPPGHENYDPNWKWKDGDTVIGVEEGTPGAIPVADAYQELDREWAEERLTMDKEIVSSGYDDPFMTPDRRSAAQAELDAISAAHAEEEKMLTPEEGEDEPKRMGMGRRPLEGPARDVRRGRRISESPVTSLSQAIRKHQSKSTMTRKELRQIIRECLAAELTTK